MRKIWLGMLALVLSLSLLSGCRAPAGGGGGGGGAEATAQEAARQLRTAYLAAPGCGGTVDVTADYGMRVYQFTLDFTWRREGESVLTVTAPEELAGLTARIDEGGARLEFDGVGLDTGDLTGEGLSPMELLPTLMGFTDEGYMAECAYEQLGERAALRVLCRDPEAGPDSGLTCVQWFDREDFALLRAELSWDGALVLSGDFVNFYLEEADEHGEGSHLGGDQPG